MTAADDLEQRRHEAEVRDIVRRQRQDGSEAVRKLFALIELRRGKATADRLRQDCRRLWSNNRGSR